MGKFETFAEFRLSQPPEVREVIDVSLEKMMLRYVEAETWEPSPEHEAELLRRLNDPDQTFSDWKDVVARLRAKHDFLD